MIVKRGKGTGLREIESADLKQLLHGQDEVALLDVRENGEYVARHIFLASSVPLSVFEPELNRLVPRRGTLVVLCDDGGGGRAYQAMRLAVEEGYTNLAVLAQGIEGWVAAGFELFEGVNVPSKTFGELLEHEKQVPSLSAEQLKTLSESEDVLLLDGRPRIEHSRMNVPGSRSLPNGDLPLRIDTVVKDADTPIVIHCAGRTRGIVGAQILRDLGLRNPVYALENGTQGWSLAGFHLNHGSQHFVEDVPGQSDIKALKLRARSLASDWNIPIVKASTVMDWQSKQSRTVYIIDVRSPEEFAASGVRGLQNVPGGQLLQTTDQWLAVRNARVALVDDVEIRAVCVAHMLRRMAWDVAVLSSDEEATPLVRVPSSKPLGPSIKTLSPDELRELQQIERPVLLDLRSSMSYRMGHIEGARWATRFQLDQVTETAGGPIVLITDNSDVASLAAKDITRKGGQVSLLNGTMADLKVAGFKIVATPNSPTDEECVDFAFFTHDRHTGNLEAARRYLSWEVGLVARIDAEERALFRIEA